MSARFKPEIEPEEFLNAFGAVEKASVFLESLLKDQRHKVTETPVYHFPVNRGTLKKRGHDKQ